jgi:hypothetical protein
MSSRCRLARLDSVVVVGVEVVKHHTGQATFEAAQRLGCGVSIRQSLAVVGLTQAVEADLGDCDAVQRGVELAVA